MPQAQQEKFLQIVEQSRQNISRFFGEQHSNPDIYACVTETCFRSFGGIPSRAKSIDDSKVILSSRALDAVTLTHELAHTEFHKRLGHRHLWRKVPMWFDEGLAVLACDDPRYKTGSIHEHSESGKGSDSLAMLHSRQQWINAVKQGKKPYHKARKQVEKWYAKAGKKGLDELINRLQAGEKFSLTGSSAGKPQLSQL